WASGLPKLQGIVWHRFWRGFVGGADVQGWKFYRRHAAALFAAAPVQFLRVFGISASTAPDLAASPYLARLVSLELIDGTAGDEGAAALAASPHLGGIRSLVGDAGALALASSPHLSRLELLDLRHNNAAAVRRG